MRRPSLSGLSASLQRVDQLPLLAMANPITFAVPVVALGGLLIGLFSIPVTRTPRWSFEQIWGAGSLIALLLLPWPLALITAPNLAKIYGAVPSGVLIAVILSGIGWGIGGIFWGKAIDALGMALGVSLLLGLINIFSSIAPLAIFDPIKLTTRGGFALMTAVAVMLGGVVLIALAGKFREREQSGVRQTKKKTKTPFSVGLILCLLSGIPSALPNFAFIFGRPLAEAARANGVPTFATSFPLWALVFTGNYLVNFLYALVIMIRRGTLRTIVVNSSPAYWAAALFMGLAWPGGIVVYGIGAAAMGPYGAYAGYPMMLLCSILAGNLSGIVFGEWKGSQKTSRQTMIAGILVMLIAFGLLGYANHLLG
jgi:L-rhamnose-H+ transport protein